MASDSEPKRKKTGSVAEVWRDQGKEISRHGQGFPEKSPIAQEIIASIDSGITCTSKIFLAAKETTEWEKIFVSYTAEGDEIRIYFF